jgi:hypothetical protein
MEQSCPLWVIHSHDWPLAAMRSFYIVRSTLLFLLGGRVAWKRVAAFTVGAPWGRSLASWSGLTLSHFITGACRRAGLCCWMGTCCQAGTYCQATECQSGSSLMLVSAHRGVLSGSQVTHGASPFPGIGDACLLLTLCSRFSLVRELVCSCCWHLRTCCLSMLLLHW